MNGHGLRQRESRKSNTRNNVESCGTTKGRNEGALIGLTLDV